MDIYFIQNAVQTTSEYSQVVLMLASEFSGERTGLSSNAVGADNPLSADYSVCFALRDRLTWIFRIVLAAFAIWKAFGMAIRGMSAQGSMMAIGAFIAIIFIGDVATEISASLCEVDPAKFSEALDNR